jgi:hypothetical protein
MPRGDGTGPMGLGPMTGRAAGYSAGYPTPGFMNPYGARFAQMPRPSAPPFGAGLMAPPAYGLPAYGPYGVPPYGAYGAAPGYGYGLAPGCGYGLGLGRGRGFFRRGRGLGIGRGRGFGW